MEGDNVTYFDNFGVEYMLKEIKKLLCSKKITTNIYRIQASDSIICGYFCIGFINFMVKGKSLLDYSNLFFLSKYEKHDKIILKIFQ